MIPCPNCTKENEDSANYCTNCGKPLTTHTNRQDIDQNIKHFEDEVNQFGKKIETMFDDAGKKIETWYDKTFGPFGPILSSIFAIIILLIGFYLLEFFGSGRPWLLDILSFLKPLLVMFIIIILISSYTNYLTKKIGLFRLISPIIGTLIFIFWFWVAIEIIAIIGNAFEISILTSFSTIFSYLIIPIAFFILIISYVNIFTTYQRPIQKEKQSRNHTTTTNQSSQPQPSVQEEYKRLYRSGNNKIVGGILGGIAEYFNVDPTIIRIIYIVFLLTSLGTMTLAYIVGWIIIPRNPSHHW